MAETDHCSKNNATGTAKIVPFDSIQQCGERLRNGNLVAFPTETVYGLGCHALDPQAVAKVFAAKERPFTDPLIVHVTSTESAMKLWDTRTTDCDDDHTNISATAAALRQLTSTFWPGPLTLVAPAAPQVPPILMANTGFVACRSPSHPLARALIEAAEVPIAAPSANKFGHVSPTRAHHVFVDLKDEDVWILDAPPPTAANGSPEMEVCAVGVESTVAKITATPQPKQGVDDCTTTGLRGTITLLRQGAVSVGDIAQSLNDGGLGNLFNVIRNTDKVVQDHVATVAPGQSIRHYSPHIPSFVVSTELCQTPLSRRDHSILAVSIVLDFGGVLKDWEPFALAYRELSESGISSQATRVVFDALRWAEQVYEGKQILFPQLRIVGEEGCASLEHHGAVGDGEQALGDDALILALKDRLVRAASGVVIEKLELPNQMSSLRP